MTQSTFCQKKITRQQSPLFNVKTETHLARPLNVIVFGQTGAGKSSLINMLARREVATVSNQAAGFTSSNQGYSIYPPNGYTANDASNSYTFWDTAGLNEGDQGTVPMEDAFENLVNLVNEQSIHLIIYCIRGSRLTPIVRVNYDLFWGIICDGKVPIVSVVTGLELESVMDGWWRRNEVLIQQMGLFFDGHACVTTTLGKDDTHQAKFLESEEKVWRLVLECCRSVDSGWSIRPDSLPAVRKSMGKYMEAYNSRSGSERNGLPSHVYQRLKGKTSSTGATNLLTGTTTPGIIHNIIIFGETGAGKSSVVNMLVGMDVARVSSDPEGCTFQNDVYEARFDETTYRIYDTVGLNEGDQGRVPHWKAIEGLYTLIRQLDGVSLLVYCMRGRIKENTHANWVLFHKVICDEKVPTIAVVTGLEHEWDTQEVERLKHIREAFKKYGMKPKDIACVVPIWGRNNEHMEKFKQSQTRLRTLIGDSVRPWNKESKEKWFADIYHNAFRAGICFVARSRLEYAVKMQVTFQEFFEKSGMEVEERDKLAAIIVKAEKRILKGKKTKQ